MKPTNIITYEITDFEEPISKAELRCLKKYLGEFTLRTNAGVEIHTQEMRGNVWNGIRIEKLIK